MVLAVILSFRRITRSQNPMTESGLGLDGKTTIVGMNGTGVMEATKSGKTVRGDRQGRDDYYEDYHCGGSRGDRQDWDDYYEDRHQDYYEDRRWEYHREDDRSGWRDWGDQDDQDDEW